MRHGRAAGGWGDDADPGLDALGRAQADEAAATLAPIGPLPVWCSPLRRTRETAVPIAAGLATMPVVHPAVGEIPSPTPELAARAAWLPGALRGRWDQLDHRVAAWRSALVDVLLGAPGDVVVVTHFVAINAAVGWATGDERVCSFAPANASITVIDTDGRSLSVVRLGSEADTAVG